MDLFERLAETAGQILNELPRDAARACAPSLLPLDRCRLPVAAFGRQFEVRDIGSIIARKVAWSQAWKPSHNPKRSDSDTFSSTASPGLIAVERSFSIMSRGSKCRRLEVA